VMNPMIIPDQSPNMTQPYAIHLCMVSGTFSAPPSKVKTSGRMKIAGITQAVMRTVEAPI